MPERAHGKVKSLTQGTVNAEVVVALPGGQETVSIITKAPVQRLGLVRGMEVHAVIKASSVLLAVD